MTPVRAHTLSASFRLSVLAIILFGAGMTACGPSSLHSTISSSRLKDMSRQGQLWVYDAENGIVVALDRLDEARDEFHRMQRQIKLANRRLEAAERRGRSLGVTVAEAWRDQLKALRKWAVARIRLERVGLIVARAAVELAKAQVIQREDLLGGKSFNVRKYADQLQEFQQAYETRKKTVHRMRRYARKLEDHWRKLRLRYVAQTGDYDSGLWTD